MDKVERFIEGMDFEQFLADDRTSFELFELLKSSVKLQSTSPASVRRRHPRVTWAKMAGMRDKLIHGYFGLDLEIVWETATRFVPELRPLIAQALREESLPRE